MNFASYCILSTLVLYAFAGRSDDFDRESKIERRTSLYENVSYIILFVLYLVILVIIIHSWYIYVQ